MTLKRGVLAMIGLMLIAGVAWAGVKEKVLYSFDSSQYSPEGTLILDKDGNLYGVTRGDVYELKHGAGGHWTKDTLYAFSISAQGFDPMAGLTFDKAGNLYGTTSNGGPASNPGGVVYEMTPGSGGQWTYNVLYGFLWLGNFGAAPEAPVVIGQDGTLYGTVVQGPGEGVGAVFQLQYSNGSWTESVLYAFKGSRDGATPGNVMLDKNGNLYGITSEGGDPNCNPPSGCGIVFKLTNSSSGWTETILHRFTGRGDGASPSGTLILGNNGQIYGSTYYGGGGGCGGGCGVVYKLIPEPHSRWKLSVIHKFRNNGHDGTVPSLMFSQRGNLYGVTQSGGVYDGGSAFELLKTFGGGWTESVLYSFGGGSGLQPTSLTFGGVGKLYGTTRYGGSNQYGTVFELALTPFLGDHSPQGLIWKMPAGR